MCPRRCANLGPLRRSRCRGLATLVLDTSSSSGPVRLKTVHNSAAISVQLRDDDLCPP